MEELSQITYQSSNTSHDQKNNRLVMLLSTLLLIFCIMAGFFAWKTQKLVEEVRSIKTIKTSLPTPKVKSDVNIMNIKENDLIASPVEISGTINKSWTWEATFSIEIVDENRKSLNSMAAGVNFDNEDDQEGSFTVSIPFEATTKSGFILVHADNPSGLPENNKTYELPVIFSNVNNIACTEEAKICPDGSAVGRSGPNCEFTPCPTPKS